MSIGLISINLFPEGLNFACPLHTFAFQRFLDSHGIDNTIISYIPAHLHNLGIEHPLDYDDFVFDVRHPESYYGAICDQFERDGRSVTLNCEYNSLLNLRDTYIALGNDREVRFDKFQSFTDRNYRKTATVFDSGLLEVEDPGFDCYICCTDVIWRQVPKYGFDRGFFLATKSMSSKRKISYAASRGVHHCGTKKDVETFLRYVSDFDAVSVRENRLKFYLEKHLNREVARVIDPVLLHSSDFWDRIAVKPKESNYLFLYYAMEKSSATIAQAVRYAKAHDLTIVETTDRPIIGGQAAEFDGVDVKYIYNMGPEEWLGYIEYANCIFTNSFHCCCFGALFERKLFVGPRNGDKVTNILNILNMSNRRFDAHSDLIENEPEDTDYHAVRAIIESEREKSTRFILDAISTEKIATPHPENREVGPSAPPSFPLHYSSGLPNATLHDWKGTVDTYSFAGYGAELIAKPLAPVSNDGRATLEGPTFKCTEMTHRGWALKARIDNHWFWLLENDSLKSLDSHIEQPNDAKILQQGDAIPQVPVTTIDLICAVAQWKRPENDGIQIKYHSGTKSKNLDWMGGAQQGSIITLHSGAYEYTLADKVKDLGSYNVMENGFVNPGFKFSGWRLRARSNKTWSWMLHDGSFIPVADYDKAKFMPRYLLREGDAIPQLNLDGVDMILMEAYWRKEETGIDLYYNSGMKSPSITWESPVSPNASLSRLKNGSLELKLCDGAANNRGEDKTIPNAFSCPNKQFYGWNLRVKCNGQWYWLLKTGEFKEQGHAERNERLVISNGGCIPYLPIEGAQSIVLEATWREATQPLLKTILRKFKH